MQRHVQVIFESLLSVMIILEIFFLVLVSIGFVGGIKQISVDHFGFYDITIGILIFIDLIYYRYKDRDPNEGNFIVKNWVYIISSIPLFFICFNLLHLFDFKIIIAIIGIVRIYSLIKVLQITSRDVSKYPQKTKLDYATVVLLLVLILGSFIFFLAERGVNPTVIDYESAIWYAIVSMTTTGYGDIVPVTFLGHIIGVIFILSGMAYVSLVTATLAYSFIDLFRKESRKAINNIGKKSEGLKDSFSTHEEKINKVLERIDELEKKIDEMEKKK
jgi:voltage-gated potassium channel